VSDAECGVTCALFLSFSLQVDVLCLVGLHARVARVLALVLHV
jgi:hypothetical protein